MLKNHFSWLNFFHFCPNEVQQQTAWYVRLLFRC